MHRELLNVPNVLFYDQ
jgi:ATP-dependent RNA/DNA helicase IGHMBP2